MTRPKLLLELVKAIAEGTCEDDPVLCCQAALEVETINYKKWYA
jgi:hypothetical protein